MLARAASICILHALGRPARVCGLSASFFHSVRQVAIVVRNDARAASGTFVPMQFSYAVRKVSHSGTPIESPVAAVVAGALGAGAALLVFAGAFLFVSLPPPQATTSKPINTQNIKRRVLDILFSLIKNDRAR